MQPPTAGRLANNDLVKHIEINGYKQSKQTSGGLWTISAWHTSGNILCLVVNDFGVKYIEKENADHLISVLRGKYEITTNWAGDKYIGLVLNGITQIIQ